MTKSLSQYYPLKMHRAMTGSIQGKENKKMRQKTRYQFTKIYKIVTFQEIRIQLRLNRFIHRVYTALKFRECYNSKSSNSIFFTEEKSRPIFLSGMSNLFSNN